jgi:hypothetical protein
MRIPQQRICIGMAHQGLDADYRIPHVQPPGGEGIAEQVQTIGWTEGLQFYLKMSINKST